MHTVHKNFVSTKVKQVFLENLLFFVCFFWKSAYKIQALTIMFNRKKRRQEENEVSPKWRRKNFEKYTKKTTKKISRNPSQKHQKPEFVPGSIFISLLYLHLIQKIFYTKIFKTFLRICRIFCWKSKIKTTQECVQSSHPKAVSPTLLTLILIPCSPSLLIEHSRTFWTILQHSGTFWNILENSGKFWNILEHSRTFLSNFQQNDWL